MAVIMNSKILATKAAVTAAARQAVIQYSAQILSDARARVPVDTGMLKNSGHLRFEDHGMTGIIAFSADYAYFVEMGTSRMGPRPYLKPAFDLNAPKFTKALKMSGI